MCGIMRKVAAACRWQRALGNDPIETPHARITTNLALPEVWDANYADGATASQPEEIDAVLASMERRLAHTPWRVVHADPFTSEPFVARLAFDGYAEQIPTIQMVAQYIASVACVCDLAPVDSEADWTKLGHLVRRDHQEGERAGGTVLSSKVTDEMMSSYRAKARSYRFKIAYVDGEPAAFGAAAASPSGAGMIEDVFTLPSYRRRGIGSTIVANLASDLLEQGCDCVFLGALAGGRAHRLYAQLGFRPLFLSRCWVRRKA